MSDSSKKDIKQLAEAINMAVSNGQAIEDLRVTIHRQLQESKQIFKERIDTCYVGVPSSEYDSLFCSIHDVYSKDGTHNCLGCNFNDLMWQISDFLETSSDHDFHSEKIHHFYSMYFFLLNGVWERIIDIFDLIGIPPKYRKTHFHNFVEVRRWTNFFKHPGVFNYLVHHPAYTIEGSGDHKEHIYRDRLDLPNKHAQVLFVDTKFVHDHYGASKSGGDKDSKGQVDGGDADKGGRKNPRNQYKKYYKSTVVVLPDLVSLTNGICEGFEHFVKLVKENPVYVEILSDESTVVNYYDAEYE